jgi:hypothetical protein
MANIAVRQTIVRAANVHNSRFDMMGGMVPGRAMFFTADLPGPLKAIVKPRRNAAPILL